MLKILTLRGETEPTAELVAPPVEQHVAKLVAPLKLPACQSAQLGVQRRAQLGSEVYGGHALVPAEVGSNP